MKKLKFEKRFKDWFIGAKPSDDDVKKLVREGKCCTFLRTTGRPCNCSMCTYEKYERKQKQYIEKDVWKEINE